MTHSVDPERCPSRLGCDAPFLDERDDPANGGRRNFLHRMHDAGYRRAVDRQCRLQQTILVEPATPCQFWISCLDRMHDSTDGRGTQYKFRDGQQDIRETLSNNCAPQAIARSVRASVASRWYDGGHDDRPHHAGGLGRDGLRDFTSSNTPFQLCVDLGIGCLPFGDYFSEHTPPRWRQAATKILDRRQKL
jgi:hypothetical protein